MAIALPLATVNLFRQNQHGLSAAKSLFVTKWLHILLNAVLD
jgi:hypothetical protein